MNRIDKILAQLQASGKKILSPYITAGDPHPDMTVALMHEIVAAGADILELGIPFSDPMAEGPVIQAAMERALAYGVNCDDVLSMVKKFREYDQNTPIVLMGYVNPIEQYGYECFAKQAKQVGVDGTILVDLPPEENDVVGSLWQAQGLHSIYLCSPTTSDERMSMINSCGKGYLYYVSLKGVTGADDFDLAAVKELYQYRKAQTNLPLMVGFGIKTAAMAAEVAKFADGVVIGAALISRIFEAYTSSANASATGASLIRDMRHAMDNNEKIMTESSEKRTHFIRQLITEELANGKHKEVITRFPPEPNGYLHVGHAKSICLNFGLAKEFSGRCYLRFDDTNPIKEEEYVNAIIDDVRWLGFEWCDITYSSDYYQQLYDYAVYLIKEGKAYVDSLSMEQIRAYRGTLQEPGRESPYRNRSIAENLDLFARMRAGEFVDGVHVLRARIDMQSGNVNLRDPVLYRIRHAHHQRTGDAWCIYPMYDYAHPLSDALEKITHSLCTLEFQDHRPLYDWFIDNLPVPAKPIQIEFARLNLSHTVTSKRKLRQLVEQNIVSGWDDPRLPTLRGMRKRGYPPKAIRQFCEIIGISRSDSVIDMSVLEDCVRNELNSIAKRAMCVLEPLKVVIENYPEDKVEKLEAPFHPQNPEAGSRVLPFSKEIYIERSDFMENPSKKYFRLSLGTEVRLRYAYVVRCTDVIRDAQGSVVEIRCTYDEDTLGKNPADRKVKGVIHWVSCQHAHPVTIYQYDRLFNETNPAREDDFFQFLKHDSLQVQQGFCEHSLLMQPLHETFQFERLGYYCVNQIDENQVSAFHRVVGLKDTWNKMS